MNRKQNRGFTLIELLLVIGILAVLLAITLIAINPAKQFSQANDTQRRSDVNAILNAINQYSVDNSGKVPPNMPAAGAVAVDIKSGGGTGDICSSLVTKYLAALPRDPKTGSYTNCTAYDTQYTVSQSASDHRITITATGEITNPISVTR